MAYEKKHGDGALFKSKNKKTDKHPDYTGDIYLDGTLYWLSAWVKNTKNGDKFLSVSVGGEKKPKEENKNTGGNEEVPFDI